jgi:acyl dehydratase
MVWQRYCDDAHVGDGLHLKLRVSSMQTTTTPGQGIVVLSSERFNQQGEVIQKGECRLMIPRRPDAIAD